MAPISKRKPKAEIKTGVYRHFKGEMFFVLGVAFCDEMDKEFVVYMRQKGELTEKLKMSPHELFTGSVNCPERNYKGPRFTLVRERGVRICACDTGR